MTVTHAAAGASTAEDGPVDTGKPFIPEELTPLSFTPSYGEEPVMRRQLLALAEDEAYRSSLDSRAIVPRIFARFDDSPELRGLSICGYRPQAEGLS